MTNPVGQRPRNGVRRGHQGHVEPTGTSSTVTPALVTTTGSQGGGGYLPPVNTDRRPSGSGTVGGAGVLSGRGSPQVSTKKLNLRDVVADPAFAPRDPAQLLRDHPQARVISDLLDRSQRILLVGHISPDGDCVGSTLSLARALKALGKQVDVVVDDVLSLSLQQLDVGGEVRRASDVAGRSWDAAIVMDVAEAKRIGGAAALLHQAAEVGVVDHHVARPTAEGLGLKPGTSLHTWVEPDFPAASLQSAAFVSRYTDELRRRGVDLKHVFTPALAGFATDTGFGNYQGAAKEYFPFFKHMLLESAASSMEELEGRMRTQLPRRLLDEVHGVVGAPVMVPGEKPLPPALLSALESARRSHHAIEATITHGPNGRMGVVTVHSQYFGALLRLAQHDDPNVTALDVANLIKWDCMREVGRRERCDLTVLLSEQRDGSVKVSARSRAKGGGREYARLLAESLGGGGHDYAAGASVNKPLHSVKDAVFGWARAHGFGR